MNDFPGQNRAALSPAASEPQPADKPDVAVDTAAHFTNGVCCTCGYAGDDDAECTSEGGHCLHWYEGPDDRLRGVLREVVDQLERQVDACPPQPTDTADGKCEGIMFCAAHMPCRACRRRKENGDG